MPNTQAKKSDTIGWTTEYSTSFKWKMPYPVRNKLPPAPSAFSRNEEIQVELDKFREMSVQTRNNSPEDRGRKDKHRSTSVERKSRSTSRADKVSRKHASKRSESHSPSRRYHKQVGTEEDYFRIGKTVKLSQRFEDYGWADREIEVQQVETVEEIDEPIEQVQ
jgi:hypothetical protein